MSFQRIATTPIAGQQPGTSGLRKRTPIFMEPGYLENYVQAVLNGAFGGHGGARGKTLVIGGDGRFFSVEAIAIILRMAAANGVARMIVGRNGLLSTPAASHLIRTRGADGGIILSASHNPGGPEGDFGVKFNGANGGPASEAVSDAIFAATGTIDHYVISDDDPPDIGAPVGTVSDFAGMTVEIVDPVADYAALMRKLFDFDVIRSLFASGFTMRFDAMHAVTGPYAKAILEGELGAPEGTVINAIPSADFAGGHPDPNPVWAKPLLDEMMSDSAPDFGAASDGDGDRNMIVGRGIYVTPSDSLALLAANAHLAPAYAAGVKGIARSMPTSSAADAVAAKLGVTLYETPTGWKFFGNLLDAGLVTLCGEESAGTGSDHVREKDGLWAVLLWLNILAVKQQPVADLLAEHWRSYGRHYYSRHDFEALDAGVATAMMEDLAARLPALPGTQVAGSTITRADEFGYDDPVDQSQSRHQGLRVFVGEDSRMVFRLSGTGTEGATMRIYLERFEPDPTRHDLDTQAALADLAAAARTLVGLEQRTGRTSPDVAT